MSPTELCFLSLTRLAQLIRAKDVSPVEATQSVLTRIDAVDPALHAYVTVLHDWALRQARAAEHAIARGEYRGSLHGVPIAVKDLCATACVRTTCGSALFADRVPTEDATVVERLAAAGAVLVGKLAMTEFACGGYPPGFPPPVNPWRPGYWAGSSSSGSAVAAAAGLCYGAIGSDTSGSIRCPASVCGVVGLKPTHGRVSLHGVFPLAASMDHVGPMTRTVADAAVLLGAIAGGDPRDPTSSRCFVPDYAGALHGDLRGLRVGVDEAFCTEWVHPEVTAAVSKAVGVMRGLGAEIRAVSVPPLEAALDAAWTIVRSEAAAAHRTTFPSRSSEYGPPVRTIIEEGSRFSAIDYLAATAERHRLRRDIESLFDTVDVLATPSWLVAAIPQEFIPVDSVLPSDLAARVVRLSAPFNLTGHPTISVPCGFTADGLPVSLQLIGRHFDEALLCRAAHAYEQATEWHTRRPPL